MNGIEVNELRAWIGWDTVRFAAVLCVNPATVSRWLAAGAGEVKLDGMPRVLLPRLHRELAARMHAAAAPARSQAHMRARSRVLMRRRAALGFVADQWEPPLEALHRLIGFALRNAGGRAVPARRRVFKRKRTLAARRSAPKRKAGRR